jgi:hypothetical protein
MVLLVARWGFCEPASLSVVAVRVPEVSSLWTPGGEREAPPTPDEQELAAELAAMQEELAKTPAATIIANHAIGLFQLAAIHLNQRPPNLDEARLAIDAFALLVDGLGDRLGEEHTALVDALAQVRLAYVSLSGG